MGPVFAHNDVGDKYGEPFGSVQSNLKSYNKVSCYYFAIFIIVPSVLV